MRLYVHKGKPAKAFEYVERAKARALLDLLAGAKNLTLATQEETTVLSSTLRQREESVAILDHTWPSMDQIAELTKHTRVREKSNENVAAVKDTVATRKTNARMLAGASIVKHHEAAALANKDFSIVEYYITENELYIFVLDSGKLTVDVVPIASETLFQKLDQFRNRISTSSTQVAEMVDSSDLYDTLIRPISGRLSKKRLYIIPHDRLYSIPFQALWGDGRYLLQKYAVTYAPSATIVQLALERESNSQRDSALVFANAYLGTKGDNLPAAEDEGSYVANSFQKHMFLAGRYATGNRFRNLAPNFDVIHLATHAYFDQKDPFNSAILLASEDGQTDPVTVRDFYRLRLKAGLVVLSACESGLSQVTIGDELIGLVRGVMYSGGRSIVASLWIVFDKSTAELMKSFYYYQRTLPKDVALQQAQIDTMKSYPEPVRWAPFVMFGDYR